MRIVLTGGGTGGHLFPNIAIAEEVCRRTSSTRGEPNKILYIGSKFGMEKDIISKLKIPYRGIYCGKLRRYFSLQNFVDWLKIPLGIIESLFILKKFQPNVIFSKGGYISVPVVIAGFILRKKIITHESDSIPGLATKIIAKMAVAICLAYEEAAPFFPKNKIQITGIPLPANHLNGKESEGYKLTGFIKELPIILVFGGSLGATSLNETIVKILPELLTFCQIIHLTGENKENNIELPGNLQKRYWRSPFYDQMDDLYQITTLAISRAGANAIAELQSFGIPSILIPLSKEASRGDQISNAEILLQKGGCEIIKQENLKPKNLLKTIKKLLNSPEKLKQLAKNSVDKKHLTAAKKIVDLILKII